VTIVETLLPGGHSFEKTGSIELGVTNSNRVDQISQGIGEGEDIVCDQCGHVMQDSDEAMTTCAHCGRALKRNSDALKVTEENIDVSDLANENAPDIWESDFPGNLNVSSTSLDAEEEWQGWRLFEGNLALNVFSGLVSGLLAFYFAVAMSLLAASQNGVHELLPYILSTALTGMAIGCFVFALMSRIPFAVSGPGTISAAILLFFLGSIYRTMAGTYLPEEITATIIASIIVTSLSAGAGLWLVGRLKAGELTRYIPIQIIGGVIGAVGVCVVIVAFEWMGNFPMDWGNVLDTFKNCLLGMNAAECVSSMGPGVVFGLVLFMGLHRFKNSLFLLGLLLVASAVGYACGIWGNDVITQSLAMPVPDLEGGVPLFTVKLLQSGFHQIQWHIMRENILFIGALALLVMLTTMYRTTRLELLLGKEVDLSKEFEALGITNIISGLCGGMPSALSYGRSAGNRATGATGPLSGIVAGIVCAAGLYFVDTVLPLIPRFVPEGLLLFSGVALVNGWMFKAKTAFTRRDDLWMLWSVFLTTLLCGLVVGVGFSVALALMVTVSRNSRGGVIRNILSGANHRSNVDRAPAQQRTLKEYGDHIHVIRLQGFLFLGSMRSLIKNIRERMEERDLLPVEYLILDFRMVSGVASAASVGFEKLHQLGEEYGIDIIITSAPLELEEHLEKSGHLGDHHGAFKVFFNLDYALEWCENHVLDAENMLHMKQMTLPELLAPVFPEPKYIPALMKVLKRVEVAKGEVLFRQGDISDSLFFVESGRLDVELEMEGRKILRLKKVGPGAVFGEMGIYTREPRTATLKATERCVLYMMTTEKLAAVEKRAPMLVSALHKYMVTMLSGRLGDANIKVRDLMS